MLRYLRVWALALIALHLLSTQLPIEHVWGAGGFPSLPRWAQGALALAALIGITPVVESAWRAPARWWQRAAAHWGRDRLIALVTLLAVPLFWLGRLQHLRWGDAYIFANAISHPEVRLTYNWQSPLSLFLHAKLWALLNAAWGLDVQTTYALVSCLAGGMFVWLLLRTLAVWSDDQCGRVLAATMFLTLGTMQLFFGYVESYTLLPVGILAFLVLGLRFLDGRGSLWPAATALAFTHSLSLSTLPLLAGLAYLALHARRGRAWSLARVAAEAAGPLLLMAAVVVAVMTAGGHGLEALLSHDAPGGGDGSWFVPLFRVETRWQHYTMFSWAHLRDILNQQLLSAPFSLSVVVGVLALRWQRIRWSDPSLRFLLVAAAAYFALTLVWNPDYGGRRDWDLFTSAAIPLTALAVHLLNRYLDRPERERSIVLIGAVSLMHLLPWVWFNAQPWPWD